MSAKGCLSLGERRFFPLFSLSAPTLRRNVIPLYRYTEHFADIFLGENGDNGQYGVNGLGIIKN